MDYSDACRLCLCKEVRMLPIFRTGVDDHHESLASRIFGCLSIEVTQYDGLPKQVCHKCECQVNLLHYFKMDCEVSQQKLSRWHRTLSTMSVSRDFDGCETEREAINIKLEPEDVQLHMEHLYTDAENSDVQECGAPMEEADSTNDPCTGHEVSNQNFSDGEKSDELSSPFNLIISETTSVVEEEETFNAPGCDIEVSKSHAKFSSQIYEDKNPSEVECVGTSSAQRHVVEVNLENSNDCVMDSLMAQSKNVTCVSSDTHQLLCDEGTTSSGCFSAKVQDPLLIVEQAQIANQPFKIKEEPAELFVASETSRSVSDLLSSSQPLNGTSGELILPQSIKNYNMKSASSSTSSKESTFTTSRSSTSAVTQLYNIELPKINNEMLDENTKFCKICQKSSSNLWRHMKNCHAEENPFQCMACSKCFPGRRELVFHRIRTVSKDCREGKKSPVDILSSFIIDKKVKYGVRGRYQCKVCKQKCSKDSSAIAHSRLHTGERPFFCYKCNKDFRMKSAAVKHVALCTAKGGTHKALAFVKDKVVSNSIRVSKVLKKKAVKPVQIKCNKCQKVFKNQVGLSNHQRMECSTKCLSCSKFVLSKTFSEHYRQCFKPENASSSEETSENSAVAKTEDIEDLELDSKDMKKKKEKKHVEEVVHMSTKELLAKHVDKDGKPTLKCQLCQSVMGSRGSLHKHLLKHTSMAFKCNLCHARMALYSKYKAHMSKFHKGSNFEVDRGRNAVATETSHTVEKETMDMAKPKLAVAFSGFKASKLRCELCMKLFSSATSLKFHKQTHKKVKCPKCEITFPASMERSHVCHPKVKEDEDKGNQDQAGNDAGSRPRPLKGPVEYTCHLCKKKFHTRKMLYQHKKMHLKMKIFKCKICDNSYSDAGALDQHKESAHPSELLSLSTSEVGVECPPKTEECQSSIDSEKPLLNFIKERPWKCGVCHKSFFQKQSFMRHIKLHAVTKGLSGIPIQKAHMPGILYCSLCDKDFKSRESFVAHKGWHSRQICQQLTDISHNISESLDTNEVGGVHQQSEKNGAKQEEPICKPFGCSECPRHFSSMRSLRIHVSSFHNRPRRTDPTTPKDNPSLVDVEPAESLVSTPYKCDTCSLTFSDLSLFTIHSSSHSGKPVDLLNLKVERPAEVLKQEPLQCKLCNKEYRCKKSLKYHMMGHSGEKPYKCRSCSNQYSNPKALAKHEKERHTTVLRPFSCNRCKTSFILKEDLLAHHEKCTH